MDRKYLRGSEEGARVCLRVSPGAKRSGIKGLYGDLAIKLSVSAPLEKGRANGEVERLLAGEGGVEVVRGASSLDKVALVRGGSEERVGGVLDVLFGG